MAPQSPGRGGANSCYIGLTAFKVSDSIFFLTQYQPNRSWLKQRIINIEEPNCINACELE